MRRIIFLVALVAPALAINVASRFEAARQGHAPRPEDSSYDDFLAGERDHMAASPFASLRARGGLVGGTGFGTGPCMCDWAGEDRAGCAFRNDGSRCFSQCCHCDCKWTGRDRENTHDLAAAAHVGGAAVGDAFGGAPARHPCERDERGRRTARGQ